ncbi:hypothetical protein GCM10029978_112440 [Actinoallomurus acanthiterrae]
MGVTKAAESGRQLSIDDSAAAPNHPRRRRADARQRAEQEWKAEPSPWARGDSLYRALGALPFGG